MKSCCIHCSKSILLISLHSMILTLSIYLSIYLLFIFLDSVLKEGKKFIHRKVICILIYMFLLV